MADRESYLYQAKLAEQAERYDEMVEAMKSIAKLKTPLSVEERNLLSVGYKNLIGTRRASWRVVTAIESSSKEKEEPSSVKMQVIDKYRAKIEKELVDICNDILSLLNDTLIPTLVKDGDASEMEAKVFYHKMKGDYYRYMSEILPEGEKRDESAESSKSAYTKAFEIAKEQNGLAAVHPIRLGLALNFSVFYYEILNQPQEAKKLAHSAFDEALKELSELNQAEYKDSTLILQLLRDNLTLWDTDDQDESDQDRQRQVEDLEDQ